MTCDKTTELLSEYLDGCLGWHENIELEDHINTCDNCRTELTELIKLTSKLKALPEIELPVDFHSDLMNKLDKYTVRNRKKFSFTRWKIPAACVAIFLSFIVLVSIYNIIPVNEDYSSNPMHFGSAVQEYDNIGSTDSSSESKIFMIQDEAAYPEPTAPESAPVENSLSSDSIEGLTTDEAMVTGETYDIAREQMYDSEDFSSNTEDNKEISTTSQKLIKRSVFSINVDNFDATAQQLNNITTDSGGYVENLSSYINQTYLYNTLETNETKHGFIVLRIPAERYEHVKKLLPELGKITSQNESSEDITLKYVDNEARLSTKKVEEKRLLVLMENSDKIEDLILLEQRLSNVRSEIESFERQLKSWDNLVQFSTIEINLFEKEKYNINTTPETSLLGQLKEGISYSLTATRGKFQFLLVLAARNIIPIISISIMVTIAAIVMFVIKRRKIKKED